MPRGQRHPTTFWTIDKDWRIGIVPLNWVLNYRGKDIGFYGTLPTAFTALMHAELAAHAGRRIHAPDAAATELFKSLISRMDELETTIKAIVPKLRPEDLKAQAEE